MTTNSSSNLVLFTLAMAERPLTIADIAFRCGLVYNTVKRVVLTDERISKNAGYPSTFEVAKPELLDNDTLFVKYDRPAEGWLTWLDSIRPLLVSVTALSDTMDKQELNRKVVMFKSLGRSFVSLSRDLDSLIDNDEWAHYLDWSDDAEA